MDCVPTHASLLGVEEAAVARTADVDRLLESMAALNTISLSPTIRCMSDAESFDVPDSNNINPSAFDFQLALTRAELSRLRGDDDAHNTTHGFVDDRDRDRASSSPQARRRSGSVDVVDHRAAKRRREENHELDRFEDSGVFLEPFDRGHQAVDKAEQLTAGFSVTSMPRDMIAEDDLHASRTEDDLYEDDKENMPPGAQLLSDSNLTDTAIPDDRIFQYSPNNIGPSQRMPNSALYNSTPLPSYPGGTALKESQPSMPIRTSGLAHTTTHIGAALSQFMSLRAQQRGAPHIPKSSSPSLPAASDPLKSDTLISNDPPADILDRNTFQLPEVIQLPAVSHTYLASLLVLQKVQLVRALRSRECSVDLIERVSLGGADIIIDVDTAVLFTSLAALPSQCEILAKAVCDLTWRFDRVLVILEAFPATQLYKPASEDRLPSYHAYSPPVIKAIKKLRRDISIAEACDRKAQGADVHLAFAESVETAALLVRAYGDIAEARDLTGGALWGDRFWVEAEERPVGLRTPRSKLQTDR